MITKNLAIHPYPNLRVQDMDFLPTRLKGEKEK